MKLLIALLTVSNLALANTQPIEPTKELVEELAKQGKRIVHKPKELEKLRQEKQR